MISANNIAFKLIDAMKLKSIIFVQKESVIQHQLSNVKYVEKLRTFLFL